MKYFNIQFHVNMWYAEYTNEQVIRRFPNIYRRLLDVLEKYPSIRVGWDIEVSVTLPYLQQVAPDVIERIKAGVHEGRYEIIVDTWSFTLPPLHTESEFYYQHRKSILKLIEVFGKVSKGYFAQEAAYSPVMTKFLAKDIDFIILQSAMLENLSDTFDPEYLGPYILKGIDNTSIKCIPFESRYLNLVECVNNFLDTKKDESILVILGDAEIFNPLELDHQFKQIVKMEVQPILVSEYVKKVSSGPVIDDLPEGTWALGVYDFFLWCRDPWDHYLWTLNEQARRLYTFTQYWISKLKSLGELTTKEEKELYNILDIILLGQNSDKFGWNPCPEKRLEGELYFREAINKLKILYTLVSEKVFQKDSETYLDVGEGYVKYFLLSNPFDHTYGPLPVYIPLSIDNDKVAPKQLNVLFHGQKLPFTFEHLNLDREGNIITATLNFILPKPISSKEDVPIFLTRGSPLPLQTSIKIMDNILENSKLKIELNGDGTLIRIENKQSGKSLSLSSILGYSFSFNELRSEEKVTKIVTNLPSDKTIYGGFTVIDDYKDFSVITTIKLFEDIDYLEIEREFNFSTSLSGELNPFEIVLSESQDFVLWRELSNHLISRSIKSDSDVYSLCENWIKTDIGDVGVLISFDSLKHAVKEVAFLSGEKIVLAPLGTFYSENEYERFRRKTNFRLILKLTDLGTPSDTDISLAKTYSQPPVVLEMSQKEGHRQLSL